MQSDERGTISHLSVPLTERLGLEPTGQKLIRREHQGVAVELKLKSEFIKRGIMVSDPLFHAAYDFIAEYDGIVNTVQVRSTSMTQTNGTSTDYYRLRTKGLGGYQVLVGHIEPIETTYLIPWKELNGKTWVLIPPNRPSRWDKWKENWDVFKEVH